MILIQILIVIYNKINNFLVIENKNQENFPPFSNNINNKNNHKESDNNKNNFNVIIYPEFNSSIENNIQVINPSLDLSNNSNYPTFDNEKSKNIIFIHLENHLTNSSSNISDNLYMKNKQNSFPSNNNPNFLNKSDNKNGHSEGTHFHV